MRATSFKEGQDNYIFQIAFTHCCHPLNSTLPILVLITLTSLTVYLNTVYSGGFSRNFFLTQFQDNENLEETGILEMDLAKISLDPRLREIANRDGEHTVQDVKDARYTYNCKVILKFGRCLSSSAAEAPVQF